MKMLYDTVSALFLLMLCLNLGLWFIGSAMEIEAITGQSVDFDALNSTFTQQAEEFDQTESGFNLDFIFGDFPRAITTFMDVMTGRYVLETLTNLGFSSDFILPLQVIVGFGVVGSIIYLVSGRA